MSLSSGARWLLGALGLVVLVGTAFLLRQALSRTRMAAEREAEAATGWQTQLSGYVDLLNQNDGRIATVVATAPAAHPERFTPDMSRSVWRIENESDLVDIAGGAQALTFPPSQIHCALLGYRAATDPALEVPDDHEVVLLAYHQGTGETGWVSHRIADPTDGAQTQTILDRIACPLQPPAQSP